jgi:hypothetical protein
MNISANNCKLFEFFQSQHLSLEIDHHHHVVIKKCYETKITTPIKSKASYSGTILGFQGFIDGTFNSPWLILFITLQLSRKKLGYLHSKNFLNCEGGLYFNQPLTPRQCKIIAAYCTSIHRLAIETGRWMVLLTSKDTRLCHFCSHNAVENRHISCWHVPYTTPFELRFQHHSNQL